MPPFVFQSDWALSDIDADTRSVNEFESATLFQAVVKCLQVIEPEKEIKTSLGKGMSGRVSACAEAAQRVKVRGTSAVFASPRGVVSQFFPHRNWATKEILAITNCCILTQTIREIF